MKKIILTNILILLTAFTIPVTADVAAADPEASIDAVSGPSGSAATTTPDPTLAFFTALSTCSPGNYQEKNIISGEVGQVMLNQQIVGPSDDQSTCNVNLTTPDNRTMTCAFPMSSLSMFSDSNFLQGIQSDSIDDPDQTSVTADMSWSQMKADNCSIGQ